ncbi:GNAT family N-acetyltransferase [candidate division KSB1 bacterium]|nr:GNAT family N-acetyltransferase [candidate division KSB1 bacterium]
MDTQMIEPQSINSEPFVEAISKSDAFAYPTPYLKQWVMKDRSAVAIRLIHPEDEPMMVKFHETLSMNSVYSRYFYYMKLNTRTKHKRLVQICSIDPEQEVVLVAIIPSSYRLAKRWGENKIIAVGRLNRLKETNDAEIAVLVSDQYQGLGLGTEILNRLLHIGHQANLDHVIAEILPDNAIMKRINEKLDFPVKHIFEDGLVKATFILNWKEQAI